MPYSDIERRRQRARERDALKRAGLWKPQPNVRKADAIQCAQCGKSFYRPPANRLKRGANQYCSRECMAVAYVGRNIGEKSPRWKGADTRPCDNCGQPVTRALWEIDEGKTFCNRACFGAWKAHNWTGEDNPCWRGGHPPYYGANWKRQQREARRRDHHHCQLCGIPESECRRALNVHHIVPFRLFGVEHYKEANALSNLISLCDSCHKYAERPSQSGTITDWPTLLAVILPAFQSDQKA